MLNNWVGMRKELIEIGRIFQKNQIDNVELEATIESYEKLIHSSLGFDLENEEEKNDIYLETGMALGTIWAATCINDSMRTKLFIKGLFEAVSELKETGKKPIHILYAGTGPFATLILPVLASYSRDEVQCTLLELNEVTFDYMKHSIKSTGLEDHVVDYLNVDATQIQLENAKDFDILVSETMQRALEKEQQVPIVYNLLRQMRSDVILIPEKIDVVACLTNLNAMKESVNEKTYCERLGSIIELSKNEVEQNKYDIIKGNQWHFPERQFEIPNESINKFNEISVLTEIQIYKGTWLRTSQSGLTTFKILDILPDKPDENVKVRIQYIVDSDPKILFKWVVVT